MLFGVFSKKHIFSTHTKTLYKEIVADGIFEKDLKIFGISWTFLGISRLPKNFLKISGLFAGFPGRVYGISEIKCTAGESWFPCDNE